MLSGFVENRSVSWFGGKHRPVGRSAGPGRPQAPLLIVVDPDGQADGALVGGLMLIDCSMHASRHGCNKP
jgi:hypothetical protein